MVKPSRNGTLNTNSESPRPSNRLQVNALSTCLMQSFKDRVNAPAPAIFSLPLRIQLDPLQVHVHYPIGAQRVEQFFPHIFKDLLCFQRRELLLDWQILIDDSEDFVERYLSRLRFRNRE